MKEYLSPNITRDDRDKIEKRRKELEEQSMAESMADLNAFNKKDRSFQESDYQSSDNNDKNSSDDSNF